MASNLMLFLALAFIYTTQALLLPLRWASPKVKKAELSKCVPSDTHRGPCIVCVCNIDGVFICSATKCIESHSLQKNIECKSNIRYIKDHTVCTCSKSGRWLSDNCRSALRSLQSTPPLIHGNLRSNVTCKPKSLYLIDCNICKCDDSGYIQGTGCTNRRCVTGSKADKCRYGDFLRTTTEICLCSDVNYYIDKLCRKIDPKVVQELNTTVAKVITNIGYKSSNRCSAFREYYVDCNHCICDEEGKLICTKRDCKPKKILRRLVDRTVELPIVNDEKEPCIPGQRYKLKCNTCMCTPNRELSCTTMICLEDFIIDGIALRRSILPIDE